MKEMVRELEEHLQNDTDSSKTDSVHSISVHTACSK